MPLHVSSTSAHRQEAKIVLYSLWFPRLHNSSSVTTGEWLRLGKTAGRSARLWSSTEFVFLVVECLSGFCAVRRVLRFIEPRHMQTFRRLQKQLMVLYRGADKSLARPGRKQANVSVRMAWIYFGALPCRKKKTWWQLASRCCWNRALPWHASERVCVLVRLRTYQHPVIRAAVRWMKASSNDKHDIIIFSSLLQPTNQATNTQLTLQQCLFI